jgi:hypothetical protein
LTQPTPEPPHAEPAHGPRRTPLHVPPKPDGAPYGYVHGGAHPSTPEQLVARLREGRPTPLVWTPETDGLVPPWQVPYLFDAYRAHGLRHSRKVTLTWLAVSLALLAWAAVRGPFIFVNGFVLFGFLAASLSFYSLLEWLRVRRLTPEKLDTETRERRSRLPARSGPARWTQMMSGGIALVMLVQAVAAVALVHRSPVLMGTGANEPSIAAAGVVKEAIELHHEYWRLLTGVYLHDGMLHRLQHHRHPGAGAVPGVVRAPRVRAAGVPAHRGGRQQLQLRVLPRRRLGGRVGRADGAVRLPGRARPHPARPAATRLRPRHPHRHRGDRRDGYPGRRLR